MEYKNFADVCHGFKCADAHLCPLHFVHGKCKDDCGLFKCANCMNRTGTQTAACHALQIIKENPYITNGAIRTTYGCYFNISDKAITENVLMLDWYQLPEDVLNYVRVHNNGYKQARYLIAKEDYFK